MGEKNYLRNLAHAMKQPYTRSAVAEIDRAPVFDKVLLVLSGQVLRLGLQWCKAKNHVNYITSGINLYQLQPMNN